MIKIFEGDIVQDIYTLENVTFEVTYDINNARFIIKTFIEIHHKLNYKDVNRNLEIISNIYENKDLLKM